MNFKKQAEEPPKEKKQTEQEDEELQIEVDADGDEFVLYKGKKYGKDTDGSIICLIKFEYVGKWDEENQKIVFNEGCEPEDEE